MIRGESEPPSSFHQPEGIGVGKAPATGCCTPGGNSPQLLKKIAIAVRGRSLTSWIDFMKRGKYAASLRALDGDSPLDFGPICEPSLRNQIQTYEKHSTHSRNRIPMRTFSAMGTCDFCFDKQVHFRCEFCCNDPLKIRANQVQCAAIQQKLCLHGAGACEFWSSKITPTR